MSQNLSSIVMRPRRLGPWFLPLVLALATALFVVFIGFRSQNFVSTSFDPYYFGKMGASLARGEGFLPFGTLIQRRAPLYPLAIGGVYWIFGEQPQLVLLLQCLLLTLYSATFFFSTVGSNPLGIGFATPVSAWPLAPTSVAEQDSACRRRRCRRI